MSCQNLSVLRQIHHIVHPRTIGLSCSAHIYHRYHLHCHTAREEPHHMGLERYSAKMYSLLRVFLRSRLYICHISRWSSLYAIYHCGVRVHRLYRWFDAYGGIGHIGLCQIECIESWSLMIEHPLIQLPYPMSSTRFSLMCTSLFTSIVPCTTSLYTIV